jgi:hypothetical protein
MKRFAPRKHEEPDTYAKPPRTLVGIRSLTVLQPYCNRASTGAYAMDARVYEYLAKCRKRLD